MTLLLLQFIFTYFFIGLMISIGIEVILNIKNENDTKTKETGQYIFFIIIWPYFIYCLIKELI